MKVCPCNIAGGIDEDAEVEAVTGKRERKEPDSKRFGKGIGVAKSKKPRILIEVLSFFSKEYLIRLLHTTIFLLN